MCGGGARHRQKRIHICVHTHIYIFAFDTENWIVSKLNKLATIAWRMSHFACRTPHATCHANTHKHANIHSCIYDIYLCRCLLVNWYAHTFWSGRNFRSLNKAKAASVWQVVAPQRVDYYLYACTCLHVCSICQRITVRQWHTFDPCRRGPKLNSYNSPNILVRFTSEAPNNLLLYFFSKSNWLLHMQALLF